MNIRVNAMCPGTIATPMTETADAPASRVTALAAALGRTGKLGEVAALAHFLVSDDASYITS
ncbi:hypothetical protein Sbs19_44450 [Sphingobium sp. BS19]|nr:hypothetical protein Sbs19_44450 [Sphingobium sp. BS19]